MNRFYRHYGKRAIDLALGLILGMALMPIIVLVAFSVRLRLGSPVLFTQLRAGRDGKSFVVFKFRTMLIAVDANDEPLPDEARITRFGAFMRKLSLDELPQLANVVRGEMSLVGPRPLLLEYLPRYSGYHSRRHEVTPGITGWAQVNGRNLIDWDTRLDLDVWYVDHQSFWLDLRILLLTVRRVLVSEGVSAEGQVTMTEFLGSRRHI